MTALRSIAAAIARRTRTSSNGFFLLLMARMVLPSVPPTATVKRGSLWNCFRLCERAEARDAVDVAGEQRRDLRRRDR